jgi:hypothetical protein
LGCLKELHFADAASGHVVLKNADDLGCGDECGSCVVAGATNERVT